MKKFILLFTLFLGVLSAQANNYFTLRTVDSSPVNDTLRVDPSNSDFFRKFFAVAHFEGYLDHWYLKITYPSGMFIYHTNDNPPLVNNITRGPAMNVPYFTINGVQDTYAADLLILMLNVDQADTTKKATILSSTITEFGYWDPSYTGNYQSYGTVKWGSGDHDYMFLFNMFIPYGTMSADITLDATLSSTDDWRGVGTVNMPHAIKTIHLVIGYQPGDVNGDGTLSNADLTLLIDWLLSGYDNIDVYRQAAADVNGDGVFTIKDVTALSDLLLAM